ncbi:MAG: beta-N-acetylhexosaminidase [Clostridia bacterium]|nr:beta-N-acetylhexosaminidase [Clostridia bacterium]
MKQKTPAFGVMLDVSRNGVLTVESIKAMAQDLARMGYNTLMLYTEDTYEVQDEPYFGHLRGRYSMEELREIVAFCEPLGLEVIPCVQSLAHLYTLFRWPRFNALRDIDDILLADEEETYVLIEKMFASLRKAFTSKKIHIGMDEAAHVGLGNYLKKHGYTEPYSILCRHLARVCEIAKKYDFEPMLWGDMFLSLCNHDRVIFDDAPTEPDQDKLVLPEKVSLVYWDYYHTEKEHFDMMLSTYKKLGRPVWFAGGAWKWGSFSPDNAFSLRHAKGALAACRENAPAGIFFTVWGDDGAECLPQAVLPALYAAACYYRGETDEAVIREGFEAQFGIPFDDFRLLDLNDGTETGVRAQDAVFNPEKYLLYNDPFLGLYDPTLTGEEPAKFAHYAARLAPYGDHPRFGKLFASMTALCRALTLKATLGKDTRKAYLAGDKAALSALLPRYTACREAVGDFLRAYRAMWLADQKPFGLEVQELRLGGLMARLDACRERLAAHLETGEEIAELEEPVLDHKCEGEAFRAGPVRIPKWYTAASPNLIFDSPV